MSKFDVEVVVVGGGPAGLTAAVALASSGIETALIGKRAAYSDNRTTALLAGSVTALEMLGAWERCRAHAAPLRTIRIVDDTGRLVRAPEVRFDASEIGLDAFGQNIENTHLVAALADTARTLSSLALIDGEAASIEASDERVTIRLADGDEITARLVIGADGRRSLCRKVAGIELDDWSYPQTALTFTLAHTRGHDDISTEFHTRSGPFTLVPLPGKRSSLVFVVDPKDTAALGALPDEAMSREIERRSHSILGKVAIEAGRGSFPLTGATARSFATRRIALIGEAAHVIPPIGAQGLNLGLRDAAAIAELVIEAQRSGGDAGGDAVLTRYDADRRADVGPRTIAVDLLNRSLLTDFLPAQGARGLGLFLMERVGPFRRALMREGVTPVTSQPRLMRGEAL